MSEFSKKKIKVGDIVGISVYELYLKFPNGISNHNEIIIEEKENLKHDYYDLYNHNDVLVFCDGEVGEVLEITDKDVLLESVQGEANQVIRLTLEELESCSFIYRKEDKYED